MIKKYIKSLLNDKILPVMNGKLKGLKLRINKLQQGSVLIRNYEPNKQFAFLTFLKEGDTFFDIGANVGLHSYFVERCISDVKIYSFEPLPENVEYIKETILLNKLKNINLIESAIGSETKKIYFEIGTNNFQGKITENKTSIEVKLITLDEFCYSNNIFPNVLKIDVEGAEIDVLQGAIKLIEEKRPIFIIELHIPAKDILVSKFLLDNNYEIYTLNDRAKTKSDKLLLSSKNKLSSWPDKDGLKGNIVAIHKSRMESDYYELIK
ncbi:MAG: FkbM family methyltransferase [Bacteroidia bacterium]